MGFITSHEAEPAFLIGGIFDLVWQMMLQGYSLLER